MKTNIFKKVKDYFKKQKENAKNDFFSKKEEYKKIKEGISLFDIFKMIKRYIICFCSIFVTLSTVSIILGFKTRNARYYAISQASFDSLVHATLYTVVQEDAASDKIGVEIANALKARGVTHSDGSEITSREIHDGITTSHSTDSNCIFIRFESTDQTIVTSVTNEVLDFLVTYYDDDHDNLHIKNFIYVGSYATNVLEANDTLPFYIFLGTLGSLLLAFGTIIVIDRTRKIINCPRDIIAFDASCFTLPGVKSKKYDVELNNIVESVKDLYANDVKNIVVVPVGRTKKEIVDKHIAQFENNNPNAFNINVTDAISKNRIIKVSRNENTIYVFAFEKGACSRKDISGNTMLEISQNNDCCFGVFFD